MSLLFIFCFSFLTFVILSSIFILYFIRLVRQTCISLATLTAIRTDIAVDEFFKKAVIVAVNEFSDSDLDIDEKKKKIYERAKGIAADVLLQHGLSPREYHLDAMVDIAMKREYPNIRT